ncbi:MAG: tRNA threonylcarbamoyladenosine dehydratase [Bacteroidales bacterium]|nr:tRNA threonylcarbamoyladenosine dehydratase [Bacteroidales bacterium]
MNNGDWKEKTRLLIGDEGIKILRNAHVLVAGLGGVGGYAVEQLCRAGIGELTIADADIVQPGNRNRQIIALLSTENRLKTEVFRERLTDINPDLKLHIFSQFLVENTIDKLLDQTYDYIVDAIDSLTPKVQLLAKAKTKGFRIVSSMGAGAKFDPSKVQVADISKSHHCRFAYLVRKYLRKYNVNDGIDVVFSSEIADKNAVLEVPVENFKRSTVGTISYLPPVFGCFCASVVVRNLLSK